MTCTCLLIVKSCLGTGLGLICLPLAIFRSKDIFVQANDQDFKKSVKKSSQRFRGILWKSITLNFSGEFILLRTQVGGEFTKPISLFVVKLLGVF